MLRYMLQWEAKESATLLNVRALERPFDYTLRLDGNAEGAETIVDLPETFNYLLGLAVSTRRVYHDGDCRYLVYRGRTRDGREAVVIWRNTEGWTPEDRERDRDFRGRQRHDRRRGRDLDERRLDGEGRSPARHPFQAAHVRAGGRLMPPRTLFQLESQLMLLGWANRQFGFESNQKLFEKLSETSEGYDLDGRSHVARTLGSGDRCIVPEGDLARYDDNVRRHLDSINAGRREPITLRYFQQLAALYAELFLDRRATAPEALAREIHNYVRERVHSQHSTYPIRGIEPDDLNKLAFWMATGSGKTLIMHLNYLQFLDYGGAERLDNVILITPNEGLSAQHMNEMTVSGIPSAPVRRHRPARRAPPHRSGHRDYQAGREEEREGDRGQHRGGRPRRPQPRVRGRGAQGRQRRYLACGARRRGRARLHLRIQRHLRSGAGGGRRQQAHRRLRQIHRLRLLLPVLPPGRIRKGLQRPQRLRGRSATGAHRPASPRQPALLP